MTTKSKIVRCGLIQCSNPINDEKRPVAEIQKAMVDKHIAMIEEAGRNSARATMLDASTAALGRGLAFFEARGGLPWPLPCREGRVRKPRSRGIAPPR